MKKIIPVTLLVAIFFCCIGCSKDVPEENLSFTVSTYAGDVIDLYSGFADGPAANAIFLYITGVTLDAAGNIYVTDGGNNRVRMVSGAGMVSTFIGKNPVGYKDGPLNTASFGSSCYIVADPKGNFFVADITNNVIRKITSDGIVSTFAGSGTRGLIDGSAQAGQLSNAGKIVIDHAGNLYVINAYQGKSNVRRISASGEITTVKRNFITPAGLAIDAQDNLYVSDQGSHIIVKISPNGSDELFAGSGTAGNADNSHASKATFNRPAGIAFDSEGVMYVCDESNHRIRRINTLGRVTTIAGSDPGYLDGNGKVALLNYPYDVTIDGSGNIFIADQMNRRVRKIRITP